MFVLALRAAVQAGLEDSVGNVPPHILQKVDERLSRATKKNASMDAERFQALAGKLEFFDLRDLQDTIISKGGWTKFEHRFGSKEALSTKFDQMAELRNSIRHSRAVGEVVRKEGEAALIWFGETLKKGFRKADSPIAGSRRE